MIFKYGREPHNTTWWAASLRPILYYFSLFNSFFGLHAYLTFKTVSGYEDQ